MAETLIETGLTAAVTNQYDPDAAPAPVVVHDTEPAATVHPDFLPEPAPPQVPAVVPRTPLPDEWTLQKVAALVLDVAQNLYDLPYILNKHKLTKQQYEVLSENEFFKTALEARTIEWHSATNTQKRLQLEAAIAAEDALHVVAARLHSKTEPLADVVALLKLLSEIAGATGAKAANMQQATGEKFKIIINLGADTMVREATPLVVVEHDTTAEKRVALQPLP